MVFSARYFVVPGVGQSRETTGVAAARIMVGPVTHSGRARILLPGGTGYSLYFPALVVLGRAGGALLGRPRRANPSRAEFPFAVPPHYYSAAAIPLSWTLRQMTVALLGAGGRMPPSHWVHGIP